MSAAKHTPGPWTFNLEGLLGPCVDGPDRAPVAAVAWMLESRKGEAWAANARLIAAAPDMYEALKLIFSEAGPVILRKGRMTPALEAALAAIAKAEGGQP